MNDVILNDGFSVQIYPTANTVAIDPEKALKAIGRKFGLYYSAQENREMRVVVGGLPDFPALELQQDISHHGSPCWDTVEILTTSPKDIEMYQNFQEILEYITKKGRIE